MEEKRLYFEPEFSGDKKHKKEKSKKKERKFLKLFFFLFFLLIIILVIIWLLKGTKTISGQYPENVRNESLTCTIAGKKYPKISSIDSEDKSIRINAIFYGSDELKTISLEYTLKYFSDEEVYSAEARSHAELNILLSEAGYNNDKFGNQFGRNGNSLIISLFAKKPELNEISASYFMIDLNSSNHQLPETVSDYKANFENQGFICKTTIE